MAKEKSVPGDSGEPHVEKSGDPLYDELVDLRVHGLKPKIAKELSLPRLMQVTDAICPEGNDDTERLRRTLKMAADRRGGIYGSALKALWGVEGTFGQSYPSRRRKAMVLLDVKTRAAFDRSHRKPTAEDLASQLHSLHDDHFEIDTSMSDEIAADSGRPKESFDSRSATTERQEKPRRHWLGSLRRRGLLALLALIPVLVVLVVITVLLDQAQKVVPPRGIAVNATTGEVERHPAISPPTKFGLVAYGPPLEACIPRSQPLGCFFHSGTFRVHEGERMKFRVTLLNETRDPLPYAKLFVSTELSDAIKEDQFLVSVRIVWPINAKQDRREDHCFGRYHCGDVGEQWNEGPVILDMPAPGDTTLKEVPKSAVLLNRNYQSIGRLPDGILEDSRGLALTTIGAPVSCFHCELTYERYVEFDATVYRYHHLL